MSRYIVKLRKGQASKHEHVTAATPTQAIVEAEQLNYGYLAIGVEPIIEYIYSVTLVHEQGTTRKNEKVRAISEEEAISIAIRRNKGFLANAVVQLMAVS